MAIQPAGHGPPVIRVYSFLALMTVAAFLRTYCRVFVLRNFTGPPEVACIHSFVCPTFGWLLIMSTRIRISLTLFLVLVTVKEDMRGTECTGECTRSVIGSYPRRGGANDEGGACDVFDRFHAILVYEAFFVLEDSPGLRCQILYGRRERKRKKPEKRKWRMR